MKVGQEIYIEPVNNAARYSKDIKKSKISKVGRKYFEIEGMNGIRFFKDNLTHDGKGYCSDYNCYYSQQEIDDKREHIEISNSIRKSFSFYDKSIPLNKLREIRDIINCF